jgi:acyl dehydratase
VEDGKFFEDLSVGDNFSTDGRTITESDVIMFAGMTADHNYLHVDFQSARKGPFGAPVAHGMLVMSIGQGLLVESRLLHGTSLGLAGFSDWRFVKPVFFGDTIRAEIEVTGTRRASRGARGVCHFGLRLLNQQSEIVQSGTAVIMVAIRPSADGHAEHSMA